MRCLSLKVRVQPVQCAADWILQTTLVALLLVSPVTAFSQEDASDEPPPEGAVQSPAAVKSDDVPAAAVESSAVPVDVKLRKRLVANHSFSKHFEFAALDMLHGEGAAQLRVERAYTGPGAGVEHFGSGWQDSNSIRLRRESDEMVVVTRGSLVWITGIKTDTGLYTSDSGHQVQIGEDGGRVSHPDGGHLEFDAEGRITRIKPRTGRTIEYTYSSKGLLQEIVAGPNNALRYLYHGPLVVTIEGPEGLLVDYTYRDGRLIEVINGWSHRIRYTYAEDGTLQSARDDFANITELPQMPGGQPEPPPAALDSLPAEPSESATTSTNPPIVGTESNGDSVEPVPASESRLLLPPQPRKEFDELGRLVRYEERGRTVEYQYDGLGRVQTQRTVEGVTRWTYDEFDRVQTVHQPDGTSLTFSYDAHDNATRIVSSTGDWEAFEYNPHGELVRTERSTGRGKTYSYDERGRLHSVLPDVGVGATYEYSQDDDLVRIHYSNGRSVSFLYDTADRKVATIWSTGEYVTRALADDGRLLSQDVNGLISSYHYDSAGRLESIFDPIHGEKRIDYSQLDDQRLSLTWGETTWSRRTNEWMDPVESALVAPGIERRSLYMYDDKGLVSDVATGTGRVWSYLYDAAGRPVRVELPGGQSIDLARDHVGRLTRVARDGTDFRSYLYDGNGRLQMETSPRGIAAVYSWDRAGRIREIIEPNGKVQYKYNERGQVSSFGNGQYEIQQEFHPDGSLARRNYQTAGMDLRFPLDPSGRPAGVSLNEINVRYEYDEFSRVAAIVMPGDSRIWILRDEAGRPTEIAFGDHARMGLTWDHQSRPTSVGTSSGPENAFTFLEQYGYDATGNLVNLQSLDQPERTLVYDEDNRLTQVQSDIATTTYGYDDNDNLQAVETADVRTVWELDSGGRPVYRGSRTTYRWTESGELAALDDTELRLANTFDAAGRLVQRVVGDVQWSFGYLPDGDRLWQEGPQGRRWYAYLSDSLAAVKDEAGVVWLIVNLPGTDRPLALCGPDNATLFIVTDHLHSIRQILDPAGQVLSSTEYGEYGQVADHVGAAPVAMYAGMVRDDHGLYYARRRYYDPGLMRFISMDPQIGSVRRPVSHNAYAYAANNPLRYRDPTGTFADEAWQQQVRDYLASLHPIEHHYYDLENFDDDLLQAHYEDLVEQELELEALRRSEMTPDGLLTGPSNWLQETRNRNELAHAQTQMQLRGLLGVQLDRLPPTVLDQMPDHLHPHRRDTGAFPALNQEAAQPESSRSRHNPTIENRVPEPNGTPANGVDRGTPPAGAIEAPAQNSQGSGTGSGASDPSGSNPSQVSPNESGRSGSPSQNFDSNPSSDRSSRPSSGRTAAAEQEIRPLFGGHAGDANSPEAVNRLRREQPYIRTRDGKYIPNKTVDGIDQPIPPGGAKVVLNHEGKLIPPEFPDDMIPAEKKRLRDLIDKEAKQLAVDGPLAKGPVEPVKAPTGPLPPGARRNSLGEIEFDLTPETTSRPLKRGDLDRRGVLPAQDLRPGMGPRMLRPGRGISSVANEKIRDSIGTRIKRKAKKWARRGAAAAVGLGGAAMMFWDAKDMWDDATWAYETGEQIIEEDRRWKNRQQTISNAESRLLDILNQQNDPNQEFEVVPDVVETVPGVAGAPGVLRETPIEVPFIGNRQVRNVEDLRVNWSDMPPSLARLLRRIRQNVANRRPPLTGIIRRRQDAALPSNGFEASIAKAKAELDQRELLVHEIQKAVDKVNRALVNADIALARIEQDDEQANDLSALKAATEKLRQRIEAITKSSGSRQLAIEALAKEMEAATRELCKRGQEAAMGGVGRSEEAKKGEAAELDPELGPIGKRLYGERGSSGAAATAMSTQVDDIIRAAKLQRALFNDKAQPFFEARSQREAALKKDMQDVRRQLREAVESDDAEVEKESAAARSEALRNVRAELEAARAVWNPQGVRALGESAEKLRGNAWRRLLPWSRTNEAQALMQRASRGVTPPPGVLTESDLPAYTMEEILERIEKLEQGSTLEPSPDDSVRGEAEKTLAEAQRWLEKLQKDGPGDQSTETAGSREQIRSDDLHAHFQRFDDCLNLLKDKQKSGDSTTETIADVFAALDPTHAFDKQVWTLSLLDREQQPDSDSAPESNDDPDTDPANPFAKQSWTLAAKDPDPEKQPKPIVPIVPENPFRPGDFEVAAIPNRQPTQPATKYPFEIARPIQPQRHPAQPATKRTGVIPSQGGPKHTAQIPQQSTPRAHHASVPLRSRISRPNLVVVPDVRGLSHQQASEVIRRAGLAPSTRLGMAAPSHSLQSQVYAQQPAPRTRVRRGTGVRAVYFDKPGTQLIPPVRRTPNLATTKPTREIPSQGTKTTTRVPMPTKTAREIGTRPATSSLVSVPDVSGLSTGAASKRVREAGLKPQFKSGIDAPSDSKSYQVYGQSPVSGSKVAKNSPVNLTIYGRFKETRVKVPDVSGMTYSRALGEITKAGLKAKRVNGFPAPSRSKQQTVYSQRPPSGFMVDKDSSVTVMVYKEMAVAKKTTPKTIPKTASKTVKPISPSRSSSKPSMESVAGSIKGPWKCSCGAKWLFYDGGGKSGKEYGSNWNRTVNGSLNGQYLRFSWSSDNPAESGGASGTGIIAFNKSFTRGNWRMTNNRGQSWEGSMTKDDGRDHRQTFNKAGVTINNRTGETLYLDVSYRSDKSGSWRWYTTRTTIGASYRGPLKDSAGKTIAASSIRISTRGASGRRYGDLEKNLVSSGTYKADSMGMHNLNIERR